MLLHRKHSTCIHPIHHTAHLTCCMHIQTNNLTLHSFHSQQYYQYYQKQPIRKWLTILSTSVSKQFEQSRSVSLEFDTSVSGGGHFIYDHLLSVGHTNSRSLNAATEGGTGHPYWLHECVWGFVLRLKGFHIPLAQGSEVPVYTMLPPVCRFNPFCPKAERERTAHSRSQTQSNTGSVPDSDKLPR